MNEEKQDSEKSNSNIIKSNWQQITFVGFMIFSIAGFIYVQGQHTDQIMELKAEQKIEKEAAIKEDKENTAKLNDELAKRTKIVNELETQIKEVKTDSELDSEKHNKEILELRFYFEKEILILHYELKLK